MRGTAVSVETVDSKYAVAGTIIATTRIGTGEPLSVAAETCENPA
jgi:hypothetical protein